MKIQPSYSKYFVFDDYSTAESLLECCDSVVAVMNDEQLNEWVKQFESICMEPDVDEYCESGTITNVFDVDNKKLVVVSDSGGELATAEFEEFCNDRKIPAQFIIDSLDCTDCEVDEIYTGCIDDNQELLEMVHKLYN